MVFRFRFVLFVFRLDIPRDDLSTTCVYLMRRSHHGPLWSQGNVSAWLISKVDFFMLLAYHLQFKAYICLRRWLAYGTCFKSQGNWARR